MSVGPLEAYCLILPGVLCVCVFAHPPAEDTNGIRTLLGARSELGRDLANYLVPPAAAKGGDHTKTAAGGDGGYVWRRTADPPARRRCGRMEVHQLPRTPARGGGLSPKALLLPRRTTGDGERMLRRLFVST